LTNDIVQESDKVRRLLSELAHRPLLGCVSAIDYQFGTCRER
jgi:hypothetical protein